MDIDQARYSTRAMRRGTPLGAEISEPLWPGDGA